MPDAANGSPETILRQCAAATPNPWYPSEYVRETGVARDDLDPQLDMLRMAGLIHLTEWVQGKGQGYALTPAGTQLLESERDLARLRNGTLRRRPAVQPIENDRTEWKGTAWDRGETVRMALMVPQIPRVTRWLVLANCLVFLAGLALAVHNQIPVNDYLNPSDNAQVGETLHQIGALQGTDVLFRGQWWRLITCCFVHIGFLHLAANMVSLYSIGRIMEAMCGRWRFLVLYLIAGLAGSCAMVLNNPLTLGAGASGAIWGLMLALMLWIFIYRQSLGPVASSLLGQLVFFLFLGIYISSWPGISAAAHFGGGAAGLAAGLLLNLERFGSARLRALALAGLVALPLASVGTIPLAKLIHVRVRKNAYEAQVIELWDEAMKLRQSLDSEPKHNSEPRSEEATVKGLAVLDEARQKLERAAGLVQQAGPFKEAEIEHIRQRQLEQVEEQIKLLDSIEYHEFLLPRVSGELRAAKRVLQQAGNDKAIAATRLEEEHVKLARTVGLLQKAGPYRNAEVEQDRQALMEFATTQERLLELSARRLRHSLTEKEEDEFLRLQRRLDRSPIRLK